MINKIKAKASQVRGVVDAYAELSEAEVDGYMAELELERAQNVYEIERRKLLAEIYSLILQKRGHEDDR